MGKCQMSARDSDSSLFGGSTSLQNTPSPKDILKTSLATLIESFRAEQCRGYYQGKGAYEAWIKGLSQEDDFLIECDRENVIRRLAVNDSMLCNLMDARGQ